MPKLKNLSSDDIAAIFADSEDMIQRLWEAADKIEKGYVDRLETVSEYARSSNALAMASTTLTARLLIKAEMQKRDDDIERLRTAKGA
jgi:hypothetical protein